jgi:hypothetical protein
MLRNSRRLLKKRISLQKSGRIFCSSTGKVLSTRQKLPNLIRPRKILWIMETMSQEMAEVAKDCASNGHRAVI